MTGRIAITLLLPPVQARALLHAADCAGMRDAEGRVVMDHFILARAAEPLTAHESAIKTTLQPPVQRVLEGTFNGA